MFSAVLHLGLAALVIAASLQREKPPEPLPPPSYAVEFEGGAPDRPAERESNPPPDEAEAAPQDSVPQEAPAPELAWAPPEEPAPPPPPQAEEPRPAQADSPRPDDLPPPPPPAPPQPRREAALTAPPRPARPPPTEPLPGLFLPEARSIQPRPPPRPAGPRPGLDLSPGRWAQPGRESPDPEIQVRGARVGPDWRSAVRRWWEDHRRYPPNAALVGDEGTATVELDIAPDGRVRSARLSRNSGSIWLDAGALAQFRGAVLPALPPGSDPSGITVSWTINYTITR